MTDTERQIYDLIEAGAPLDSALVAANRFARMQVRLCRDNGLDPDAWLAVARATAAAITVLDNARPQRVTVRDDASRPVLSPAEGHYHPTRHKAKRRKGGIAGTMDARTGRIDWQ